jgi:hypothetical protein
LINPGLRTILLADSAVKAAVSNLRVYFVKLPQEPAYPAISMEVVGGDPGNVLHGVPKLQQTHVRIHCWSKTYAGASALMGIVEAAINGQQTAGGGLTIKSCTAGGRTDSYEETIEAYYTSQDFSLWHKPTPTP